MRYYLEELPLPTTLKINELYREVEAVQKLFFEDSLCSIKNDKLCKYKIECSEDSKVSNYIDNYTLLACDYTEAPHVSIYHIPYTHHIISLYYHRYKLHPESSTTFVIEKNENKIMDFYFESPLEASHHSLKDDIASLLSYLK